mgnify:CR=1 FL=1
MKEEDPLDLILIVSSLLLSLTDNLIGLILSMICISCVIISMIKK